MLTELTRVCPLCHALLPDPAATTCTKCGRGMAPHHETWGAQLKWWMLHELQVDSLAAWRNLQDAWEEKLLTVMNGCSNTKPTPWGLPVSRVTPIPQLLPLAHERAAWWRAAGSPIERRILAAPEKV
jgi:hypothetical protein